MEKITIIIFSIISLILGIIIYTLIGSSWTCIVNKCIGTYTNDDWVKNNCNLIGTNMTCSFVWQNQFYSFPLSNLNVTYMIENQVGKYCNSVCQTKVLTKNINV
jgi:hypothetical protein